MKYSVIAACVFCWGLGGCTREEPKTLGGIGKVARLEQKGKTTKLTVEGLGKDSTVIDITPAAVIRELGIPLYPGAKIDPGSEVCAVSKQMKRRSCRARLRTRDPFDKVVSYYRRKMATGPMTVSITGVKMSLIVKTVGNVKQTVHISHKKDASDTRVELISIQPLTN